MTRVPGSRPVSRPGPRPRPGPKPHSTTGRLRTHEEVRRSRRSTGASAGGRPRGSAPAGRTTPDTALRFLRPVARITARIGLGVIVLAIFVFGVFPTGRYVDQREQLDRANTELSDLLAENAELRSRIGRLESDAEIERVARSEYDMVMPEEEVYAVLPPAGG